MSTLEAKGIAAWIEVNEDRLECYSPNSWKSAAGDAPVMNCWVASQAGEAFAVVLSTPRGTLTNDYVASLRIDGHRMSDRIISRADKSNNTWWNGVRDGNLRRPFIFASPNVTDDDTLLDSLELARNSKIGEIKIQIHRITGLHDVEPSFNRYTLPPVQTVHKTSIKAARPLHQISLGEGAPEFHDPWVNISATFVGVVKMTCIAPIETLIENRIALPPANAVGDRYMFELGSGSQRGAEKSSASMDSRLDSAKPGVAGSTSSLRQSLSQHRPTQYKPLSQVDMPHVKRESELEANVQDIKPEVQAINDLDDEERHLMEQLELVRKRKRDALQDVEAELPAKTVKTESSVLPGGSVTYRPRRGD